MGEVDQPGAGQLRVEDRAPLTCVGRGRGRRSAGSRPRRRPCSRRCRPGSGCMHSSSVSGRAQSYASSTSISAGVRWWKRGQVGERPGVRRGPPRRGVHRLRAQRAGVVLGHATCRRRPVRRRGSAGAARSSAPGRSRRWSRAASCTRVAYVPRTRASSAGGSWPAVAPGAGVERVPGQDAQLHALAALRALRPGGRSAPTARSPRLVSFHCRCGQLLDDRVVLRQPPAAPVLQRAAGRP